MVASGHYFDDELLGEREDGRHHGSKDEDFNEDCIAFCSFLRHRPSLKQSKQIAESESCQLSRESLQPIHVKIIGQCYS